MRIMAVVCNIVLFAFTCIVVLIEGIPRQSAYLILTLLPLLVPIVNVVVLLRGGMPLRGQTARADSFSRSTRIARAAAFCNLGVVVFAC